MKFVLRSRVFDTIAFFTILSLASCLGPNVFVTQRLERQARVWQHLQHPNVAEFFGLAFSFGYMPALILPFYGNGTVIEFVKEKDDQVKLDMVLCFAL
jgi:O-antigen/teichoic acid export membrane protein